jgi:hypothetical protein
MIWTTRGRAVRISQGVLTFPLMFASLRFAWSSLGAPRCRVLIQLARNVTSGCYDRCATAMDDFVGRKYLSAVHRLAIPWRSEVGSGCKVYIARPRVKALLWRHRGQVVGKLPCSNGILSEARPSLRRLEAVVESNDVSCNCPNGLASFLVGQLTQRAIANLVNNRCSQNVAFAKKGRSKNERTRQHGIVQTQECMIRADVPVRCDRSNLIVGTPLGTSRALRSVPPNWSSLPPRGAA